MLSLFLFSFVIAAASFDVKNCEEIEERESFYKPRGNKVAINNDFTRICFSYKEYTCFFKIKEIPCYMSHHGKWSLQRRLGKIPFPQFRIIGNQVAFYDSNECILGRCATAETYDFKEDERLKATGDEKVRMQHDGIVNRLQKDFDESEKPKKMQQKIPAIEPIETVEIQQNNLEATKKYSSQDQVDVTICQKGIAGEYLTSTVDGKYASSKDLATICYIKSENCHCVYNMGITKCQKKGNGDFIQAMDEKPNELVFKKYENQVALYQKGQCICGGCARATFMDKITPTWSSERSRDDFLKISMDYTLVYYHGNGCECILKIDDVKCVINGYWTKINDINTIANLEGHTIPFENIKLSFASVSGKISIGYKGECLGECKKSNGKVEGPIKPQSIFSIQPNEQINTPADLKHSSTQSDHVVLNRVAQASKPKNIEAQESLNSKQSLKSESTTINPENLSSKGVASAVNQPTFEQPEQEQASQRIVETPEVTKDEAEEETTHNTNGDSTSNRIDVEKCQNGGDGEFYLSDNGAHASNDDSSTICFKNQQGEYCLIDSERMLCQDKKGKFEKEATEEERNNTPVKVFDNQVALYENDKKCVFGGCARARFTEESKNQLLFLQSMDGTLKFKKDKSFFYIYRLNIDCTIEIGKFVCIEKGKLQSIHYDYYTFNHIAIENQEFTIKYTTASITKERGAIRITMDNQCYGYCEKTQKEKEQNISVETEGATKELDGKLQSDAAEAIQKTKETPATEEEISPVPEKSENTETAPTRTTEEGHATDSDNSQADAIHEIQTMLTSTDEKQEGCQRLYDAFNKMFSCSELVSLESMPIFHL